MNSKVLKVWDSAFLCSGRVASGDIQEKPGRTAEASIMVMATEAPEGRTKQPGQVGARGTQHDDAGRRRGQGPEQAIAGLNNVEFKKSAFLAMKTE